MAKTVNYTPEQTQEIIAAYTAANSDDERKNTVAALSEHFGKSVASIRQKLVREGVYQKQVYVSKNGAKAESKAAIVKDVAESLGVTAEQAESLEKANKGILLKLREALSE